MAVHIHAQVTIPYYTGVPEDISVNNWSFDMVDDDLVTLGEAEAFLGTFYGLLAEWMSPVLNLAETRLKFYRRADTPPRVPVIDSVGDMSAVSVPGVFPEEVAACLSFRGELVSGQPQARRRGRVFLGPLGGNVVSGGDATSRSRLQPSFSTAILDAYEDAWTQLTTAGNVHEVWSPSDAAGYPVVRASVDNAFDTQRSRGPGVTAVDVRNGPF